MPPPRDERGGGSAATGPRVIRADAASGFATFHAGDVLSHRFKIVQFLAQGGMGEVYEAEDLELGRTVALKTIRPEIATEPRIVQRFKREITLSLKVTHPNVCRIFDLFHHRGEWGTGVAELSFLAMELLRGETLASRLRAVGRMTSAEALPIVEGSGPGFRAPGRRRPSGFQECKRGPRSCGGGWAPRRGPRPAGGCDGLRPGAERRWG